MYEWNEDLATGNALIDKQHKQLIQSLNDLLQASRTGKGCLEVQNTLEFLLAYTIKHFADEEKLQQESDYPDYLTHREYHNEFKGVARSLADKMNQNGASEELVAMVYESVGEWLVNHIKGDDFRLAAHLRQQQADIPQL